MKYFNNVKSSIDNLPINEKLFFEFADDLYVGHHIEADIAKIHEVDVEKINDLGIVLHNEPV